MLLRLLKQFLRPYKRDLTRVIVLQLAATAAMVDLPNLYARIIDRGVANHDVVTILSTGAVMLVVSAVQVACSIAAAYYGARTAVAYGRDLRAAVFHRVGELSAHAEIGRAHV